MGLELLSRQELAHHPDVLAVLNCSQLISLAALLFEVQSNRFQCNAI